MTTSAFSFYPYDDYALITSAFFPTNSEEEDPLQELTGELHALYCDLDHHEEETCGWLTEECELMEPWLGEDHQKWYAVGEAIVAKGWSLLEVFALRDQVKALCS